MKVLISVDGSEHAEKALKYYFNTIHKECNEVVVYSHVEIPGIPMTWLGGMPMLTHEEIQRLLADHKVECKKFKESLKKKCADYQGNITVAVESDNGKAGHSIIKKAEACGAQLIVTGTRGMGQVRRTVLGSVSDYVTHHSKVPVMVCHA